MKNHELQKNLDQAVLEHRKGNLKSAGQYYLEALRLAPGHPEIHHRLGLLYLQSNDLTKATSHLKIAVDDSPRPERLRALVSALLQQSRWQEAMDFLASRLESYPAAELSVLYRELLPRYCNYLHGKGNYRLAAEFTGSALEKEPENPVLLELDGVSLLMDGKGDAARDQLEKALDQEPGSTSVMYNLAMCYQAMDMRQDAARLYKQLLGIDAAHAGAWFGLARLKTGDAGMEDIALLEDIASSAEDLDSRAKLLFAIAEILSVESEPGQYIKALKTANDCVYEGLLAGGGSKGASSGDFRAGDICSVFTRERIGLLASPEEFSPVFILAMPRSGTSLLAQVLSGHSEVHNIGENSFLGQAIEEFYNTAGRGQIDFLYHPETATKDDTRQLAEILHRKMAEGLPAGTRPLDKTIHNFLSAGLLAILFPKARFLCLKRDRMDVLFSCYRQVFFPLGKQPYIYNPGALEAALQQFNQLANHWQDILGERLLTTSYETLVNEPGKTVGRILEHCGLEWEDRCLELEKRDNVVLTASMGQVKSKITASLVGGWEPYRQYLEEIFRTGQS